MPKIVVIAHNIRSTFNVGSIFRTCEGFGVERLILSGYTPYPDLSLCRETPPLDELQQLGYRIAALEQAANSTNLRDYSAPDRIALLLGEEVNGIAPEWLALADDIVEIPMFGQKESFNVSVAAGIALYELATSSKTAKNA